MKTIDVSTEQLAIHSIRMLSIDMIEKANSGHPGIAMGAAPMAYELWANHMNHNPANSSWFNRDRFVLSAGHGSALLYSLLHLSGYHLPMEELKRFRQWGSKTPGHPEYGLTDGVEATTGPLGQGVAMAVGMAMAEQYLAAKFNKDEYPVIEHFTYSICGDGDLMEGVSQESASLAGHLKLGKLIVLYDSNDISLDGDLNRSFSESVENRYKSYGWQVIRVEDGNDLDAINAAIKEAKLHVEQPTLIEVKTTIGYGSPNKAGTSKAHGAPLGEEEIKLVRENYDWEYEDDFYVPDEVYSHFKKLQAKAEQKEKQWNELVDSYRAAFPELGKELELVLKNELPVDWGAEIPMFEIDKDELATRAASGKVLNGIAKKVPQFLGGSADLAGSNKTQINGAKDFTPEYYSGRNIWFGVREFAMGAALNGMALHGGLKVFGGTFFVFSDYLRPAIRLSALMEIPVTYVFTHDSIAVGEDGPTHEPVEQLASLRAMPGLSVIRPADANETAAAWRISLESKGQPTVLALTRQSLPTFISSDNANEGVRKGAYLVNAITEETQGLLLASGSEVSLAIAAKNQLEKEGILVSVVSMPSWDRFDEQEESYKEKVLPENMKTRLAIEMGASLGWNNFVGDKGEIIAIDRFGASAPGEKLLNEFGFTVENVIDKFKNLRANNDNRR